MQAKALAGSNTNYLFPEEEKITIEGVKQTDCVTSSEELKNFNNLLIINNSTKYYKYVCVCVFFFGFINSVVFHKIIFDVIIKLLYYNLKVMSSNFGKYTNLPKLYRVKVLSATLRCNCVVF